MEHTPAKWGIMPDGPQGDGKPWAAHMEAAAGLTIGCDSNTEPVCRVSGYLMPVKANARLIASAPALLSAMERIRSELDGNVPNRAAQAEVLSIAWAAIKAAKS